MPLELDFGPAAQAFRAELREWLETNKPAELIGVSADALARGKMTPAAREWVKKLSDNKYMCVSWPKEYGGRGLSGLEVAVMNEEFARANVPRITRGMGEWLVGPSIIVWGTEEQKKRFLPRIIDGTDRYCQGFSEPDAGSDLAALKTRGVIDGEEVVITGQKVWTSGATEANMMFCLCRTDFDVPKHQGISYVLLPMFHDDKSSNGIELRPIQQPHGASHFTETFLTESRAPVANIIGGMNNGWRVTMTTLGNERGGNATTQHVEFTRQFWDGVKLLKESGKTVDPVVRQQLAWAFTHVEIMRFQGLKLLSEVIARKEPGPAASINKMFWSEYAQKFSTFMVNARGADSLLIENDKDGKYEVDRWIGSMFQHRSSTIWGGTAQVQRNIVGERVLGLPKEPDPNKPRPQVN
jgi:alkylation response protein AidB-like acyl-CoA dehydrogenase